MMIILNLQIFALCVLGVLIFLSLFVFSKDSFHDEAEKYEEIENLPTYHKVEKPTLPTPTLEELNIAETSKLAKIYEMLVRGDILTDEIVFRALGSKRASIFIFRLREKGMVIDTLIMPNGKSGYAFRNFKL
jgi:hypothetical protein